MKIKQLMMLALLAISPLQTANAGIIDADVYVDDAAFTAATGAISLTGALPQLGNVGNSVTLGDATLNANDDIFVGSGWSSLLPGGMAIAISGPEDLGITINTGAANAFGFYFHEPASSTAILDGCNTACVDSTFLIEFLIGATLVDSISFTPLDDVAAFYGIILDMNFDSVRFTETIGSNDNEFFGEMYVARNIPEPSTLLLLGVGVLAMVYRRKRV